MIQSRRSFTIPAVLSTFAVALAAMPLSAAAQDRTYAVAPIAVTGEAAPGTGGLSFTRVDFADLNDSGLVAIDGSLEPFGSYDEGIWVGSPGNLSLVVRAGDPAPGIAAHDFFQFSGGAMANASGDVVLRATCRTDGGLLTSCTGLWTGAAGNLQLLALNGDPAPGTAGFSFGQNFAIASFDDLGVTSFNADFLTPEGQRVGVWTGTPGSLQPIVVPGDPVPDTVGLSFVEAYGLTNRAGTTVIAAATDDPTVYGHWGYWKTGAGGLSIVAKGGDEAPGTGGRTFGNLTAGASGAAGAGWPPNDAPSVADVTGPILNPLGHIAFNGFLDPIDPLTGYGDEGIWIQDDLGLRLVTMVGDPAPGTAGLQFGDFNHVNFNSLGQVAFDAGVNSGDPANDRGIWRGLPDNLTLLVREGDPAPGTAGETFKYLTYGPSLNDTGELVFQARLAGSGNEGIWVARADGLIELVLREGEVLKVKDGDYRTIQTLGIGDGMPSSFATYNRFNEAGQMVLFVEFTDGTNGDFLASPIDSVPNQPPVASAGPDQWVIEGRTLVLYGSGSFDPEETVLTFVWSVGGVEIATGPHATVGPFAAGLHTITLTVTDRSGASASDDMVLTVEPNLPPVANAGLDKTVSHGWAVLLNGFGSSDPEGGALEFAWTLDGVQIGAGPNPNVGPFAVGVHTVILTVTDDIGNQSTDSLILTVVNLPPTADAGPDRTIETQQQVWLNGSGSSDPEDESLSYVWSLDGVQIGVGQYPALGPFEAGLYAITLTVTDGHGASATDEMILTVLNRAPRANAGPDQSVNHAQAVTLDGSRSYDGDGTILSYVWSLDGVQIATGPSPVVGPFAVGVRSITLTVTDDHGATAADSMVVTVVNEAPIASAGPDQTANHAQTVTLAGSGSDPESGPLSYTWSIGGVEVATGANPTVGPFDVGVHTVTLTVTDNHAATASDSMTVTVVNEAPVANAGPDQAVSFKGKTTTVTLDGSASSDPEGGVLSYLWTLDGQTVGTGAVVQVDVPAGTHTFTLTVTDDHGATAVDTVVVTATKGGKGS
jgi:hypothetical protein